MNSVELCRREKQLGRSVILIDTEPTCIRDIVELVQPTLVISSKLDAIEDAKRMHPENACVYLPTFVEQLAMHDIDYAELLDKRASLRPDAFCVFAYSNCDERWDGVRDRRRFYERLVERSGNRVTNLGNCYSPGAITERTGSAAANGYAFRGFKFTIAFENKRCRGYVSEKLVNAMLAGTVPIYYGAQDVVEHFNPLSFVNVADFPSFDACIDHVLRLDADDAAYDRVRSQPWMTKDQMARRQSTFSFITAGSFYADIFASLSRRHARVADYMRASSIVGRGVTFVTFADGNRFTSQRIMKEAGDSHYFKRCVSYDRTMSFLDGHRAFVDANKRGFGYWIWKPACVLQVLTESAEDDIVVWSDCGTVVVPHRATTVCQWYEMLTEGGKDILITSTGLLEEEWSKMDAIASVFPGASAESLDAVFARCKTRNQLAGSLLFLKNTKATRDLVKEWRQMLQIYSLVDDSPSSAPNSHRFREHRHDQSILSLLLKHRFPADRWHILYDMNEGGDAGDAGDADPTTRPFAAIRGQQA
jgi:hypothetical protein